MCNPVAIGLVVAGTALSVNAQNRRQAAMEDAAAKARLLESTRQKGYEDQREAALTKNQDNMTLDSQEGQLADAAAAREAAYNKATTLPEATYGQSGTASNSDQPTVVQSTAEKARAKADADVQKTGAARAKLRSFDDLNLNNAVANTNAGNQIGMWADFARQSAGLLPGEVQSAMASKSGKYRTQELLGTAMSMYGGAGAPALFGGAAAAGTAAAGAGAASAGAAGAGAGTGAAGGAAGAGAGSGMGLGGLLSMKNTAPLFGTATTSGYLPGFLNLARR